MGREPDPTDIRARERERAEQAERARVAMEREAGDFRWLMANERGRRFVALVLEQSGMDLSCFSANTAEMARMEGERQFGLRVKKLVLQHCPDLYVQMLSEQLGVKK